MLGDRVRLPVVWPKAFETATAANKAKNSRVMADIENRSEIGLQSEVCRIDSQTQFSRC